MNTRSGTTHSFILFTPWRAKVNVLLFKQRSCTTSWWTNWLWCNPVLIRGVDLMSTLYSFCFIFVCWGSVLKRSIDLDSTFYWSWFCIFYLYYILYLFRNVNTDSMNVYLNNLIFFNRQGYLDHIVPYCRRWCSFSQHYNCNMLSVNFVYTITNTLTIC